MHTKLNQWRIFCETENTWVYEWLSPSATTPTVCFNDSAHTVNSNSISISDTLLSTEVTVKEETTKTQGNFRTEGFTFDIPAQSDYIGSITFPYSINLLSVWFNITEENVGDHLTVNYQPLYAGALTADIATPSTTITVDLFTANILNTGYVLILKRSSDNHTERLGEVLSINKTTGVLTVTTPTTEAFVTGDSVYLNVTGVKNLSLANIGRHSIGTSKIGAAFIMAGGSFYASYTNNTPASTKKFHYELEYLY